MSRIYDEDIDKHIDWGGDASTEFLPVSGAKVQKFIKDTLNQKAGLFYYDATNNRYLVFADSETKDEYLADPTKTSLILGTFNAPFNYSAEITLTTPTYNPVAYGSTGHYLDFTWDVTNKSGVSTGEGVICTYTFMRGSTTTTTTAEYSANDKTVHFPIDSYLLEGTNNITIGIIGKNTLAATTVSTVFQVIDLQIEDDLDISEVYENGDSIQIQFKVTGAGTKTVQWYVDGSLLQYDSTTDQIIDSGIWKTKYIGVNNLSIGRHSLQYRALITVNGQVFYSDTLYRDFIVTSNQATNPVFAVKTTIPRANGIITNALTVYGMIQYVPYTLTCAAYNPSITGKTNTTVSFTGEPTISLMINNYSETALTFTPTASGAKTIAITATNVTYSIPTTVASTTMNISELTNGLEINFTCEGRTNESVNRNIWTYGNINASFNNFKWNETSGWNNNRLIIDKDSSLSINYCPLSHSMLNAGKTIELEFSSLNVTNDNAVLCSILNNNIGLKVTATEASLTSVGGTKISTKYKSDENIRIDFVINPLSGVTNKQLVFIYINGVNSGAINYAQSDTFETSANIVFAGSSSAEISLKQVRIYNRPLSDDEILNNYILYQDSVNAMNTIYDSNDIYTTGTYDFDKDKLSSKLPVMLITGNIPALEATTDKNFAITVDIQYTDLQDITRSFTAEDITMTPQGTSSMSYPKKNYRIYTSVSKSPNLKWYNYLGVLDTSRKYAFKAGAQAVDRWCLKADYAESSGTHNTGISRLWNKAMKDAVVTFTNCDDSSHNITNAYALRTQAQTAAISGGFEGDVRTAIDGFPIVMFYRLTETDTPVFMGKYNFNNDKATESVFGFKDIPGFDNTHMQCWEVLANENEIALFNTVEGFYTQVAGKYGWESAFEARYPDSGSAADTSALYNFCSWMTSVKDSSATFRTQKWDHLDVYKVAAYYIYLMRFGAVDQVVKNAMFTSEDGVHFYFINYDNDTVLGVRNDGKLIFNPDINRQSLDTTYVTPVYAYAGHNSSLWNRLEADDEFMAIVKAVDGALYVSGINYSNASDMFDNKQSHKWCERVYNKDAQYKYVGPYNDGTYTAGLEALQGRREAHRRWWLSHRFDLYDSINVTGEYRSKVIEIKANTNLNDGSINRIPFTIKAGYPLYYGWGINNVVHQSGVYLNAGDSSTFVTDQNLAIGDPLRIYSANNIKEVDFSNFQPYLTQVTLNGVYSETNGTKLTKLVIGSDTSVNTSLTTTQLSGLAQAKSLEYLDVQGFQNLTSLDLSEHKYLTTLKANNSGLTSVSFAKGASLTLVQLPSTLQELTIEDNNTLTTNTLSIQNNGCNVYDITIKNSPSLCNNYNFIKNWYTNKNVNDLLCSVYMDNIQWTVNDVSSLIALGGIGDLVLKGTINIVNPSIEQINMIASVFGTEVFDPNNELYITDNSTVMIVGPDSILEGSTGQYSAIILAGDPNNYSWSLSKSRADYSIDASGKITTTEVGLATESLNVILTYTKQSGVIGTVTKPIQIVATTYPSINEVSISGATSSSNDEEIYTLMVSSAYTGVLNKTWSISGFDNKASIVGSSTGDSVKIKVTDIAETASGTISVALWNSYTTPTQIGTKTLSVMFINDNVLITTMTNPYLLQAINDLHWNDTHPTYFLKEQAHTVGDASMAQLCNQIKNNYSSNITSLNEFGEFTNVEHLPANAFVGNSTLNSIILPPSLVAIPESCFSSCNISSIIIPKYVTEIKTNAFYSCYNLSSVTFAENSSLDSIKDYAFGFNYALTSIDLPEGLRFIYSSAFMYDNNLTSLYIPASVVSFSPDAVSYCDKLESIVVDEDNQHYSSQDLNGNECNAILSLDKTKLIRGCKGTVLFEGLTEIGYQAFAHITYYGDSSNCLRLPNTLVQISSYAFYGCNGFTSIEWPDNPSFTTIYENSFYMCGLTTLVIPDSITTVENSAFWLCQSMNSLTIGKGLTNCSETAFGGCIKLRTITVDASNPTFKDHDTGYSNALYNVLTKTLLAIGAEKVENYVFPSDMEKLGDNIFYLRSNGYGDDSSVLDFRNTHLKTIGFSACAYMNSIKKIYIPSTIETIQGNAFQGTSNVIEVYIYKDVAPSITEWTWGQTYNTIGYDDHSADHMLYVPANSTGYDTLDWIRYMLNDDWGRFDLTPTLIA